MSNLDFDSTIPALDLEMYHFRRSYGDIEAFGTWFGRERRPCLVLLRKGDYGRGAERVRPCVFPLENAWIYAESVGDPIAAAHSLARMAPYLGIDLTSTLQMTRLMSIMRDLMGDWLSIPPKPRDKMEVRADAILTNLETGKTRTAEIMDDT